MQTSQSSGSGGQVVGSAADNSPTDDVVIQELKPVDGGVTAWTVLIAAFVFEAILWGMKHRFSL